ncbi:MAG: methylmalonyl Co-A mutase-associated GTPase MeaB [Bacteroidota bacterium]
MDKPSENKSALKVNKGVEQPPSVRTDSAKKYRRRQLEPDDYFIGVRSGDRSILSQAITLIESSKPEHAELAQKIIEMCLPYSGNSVRIGITGVPGVGKSSFIETFGKILTSDRKKVAVLAIDPSSGRSKGSILGDKTRMEDLATDQNAYIRPSPSAGNLGGVARKTRETIILCEAAGYEIVFIETVGVGQSETAVHSLTDFFLLLMIAGAGDELQGIKRGIMEMADHIAINKADGDNIIRAEKTRVDFENAVHYFPVPESGWKPMVTTCSALKNHGFSVIWDCINNYISHTKKNGYFELRRNNQLKYWMYEAIDNELWDEFRNNTGVSAALKKIEKDVLNRKLTSFVAAKKLLELFREK